MPVLHLFRHAKSSREIGMDDHERPLSGRGRRTAPAMAAWMAENRIAPSLVLVSTARRCRETWAAMQPFFRPPPDIRFEDELYLASADELLERLHRLSDDGRDVMVVGHNPGLHELALGLAVGDGAEHARLVEKFSTAALCTLETEDRRWSQLRWAGARFLRFIRPADILEQ